MAAHQAKWRAEVRRDGRVERGPLRGTKSWADTDLVTMKSAPNARLQSQVVAQLRLAAFAEFRAWPRVGGTTASGPGTFSHIVSVIIANVVRRRVVSNCLFVCCQQRLGR